MRLSEATEAASFIRGLCDADEARIILGWVLDPAMEGRVRVTLLATGFDGNGKSPLRSHAASDVSRATSPARALEMPAMVRQYAPPAGAHEPEQLPEPDGYEFQLPSEDDLDTPAFIRRR